MGEIRLRWLGGKPAKNMGVTWGIPWGRGILDINDELELRGENGESIPIYSWVTAYWPDGSVKWTAHAASFGEEVPRELYILKKEKDKITKFSEKRLVIKEFEEYVQVDTGVIVCNLPRRGNHIIREIWRGNAVVCKGAELVCIREGRYVTYGLQSRFEEHFISEVLEVSIEQNTPIRCVIRIRGRHVKGNRGWLPFDMRLYFYAGQDSIKFVYTFFYDGNPYNDFIKGLGICFYVPLNGPLYNRYVRFAGDTGFFAESPKNLATFRTIGRYKELYEKQFRGENIEFDDNDMPFVNLLNESAVWNYFKLIQKSADDYVILKRTKEYCCWIEAARGRRSKGMAYIGCQDNGVAVGMKYFWQKYPTSLEVEGMQSDVAKLNLWFWSPDAETMDLRPYDVETHLMSSYEGFNEMRSTPYGIANTSEFTLFCLDRVPSFERLNEMAEQCSNPPLLVCMPEYYRQTGIFGIWSLVDRNTPEKSFIEDQLDAAIRFYQQEIEQRKWYGFWNYGDFMHSYDDVRHTWRYDVGGCAWQNTELVPNMWLWYMFLRTGREDIFRMAEAMTRHTSEVDMYHFGEYRGLGSRHNVLHWGCGCKEARISMAGLHRYYYYLTVDERVGDIMDEVKDVDHTVGNLDPMRAYYIPDLKFKTHVRVGPDVMAFCSNWFTRWERYQDVVYRDKLLKCIDFFKSHPYAFICSGVYGYDPEKTQLYDFELTEGSHFMFCFGSQFVWVEIAQTIEDPAFDQLVMDLGQFYSSFVQEKDKTLKEWGVPNKRFDLSVYNCGLAAYAANRRSNEALAVAIWKMLLLDNKWIKFPIKTEEISDMKYIKPIREIRWISTNAISQWSINVIMSLALIGEMIPKDIHKQVMDKLT